MFARASKQRIQAETFRQWQHASDGLHLPWLCPFLYTIASRSRKTSTINKRRSKPNIRTSLFQLTAAELISKSRGLASASPAEYNIPPDDFVPFEGLPVALQQPTNITRPWLERIALATIRPLDPENPIIIDDTLTSRPPRLKIHTPSAIGGSMPEIMEIFRACLQVGRFPRAATIMRRLNHVLKPEAPELIAAHNDYLRELVQIVVRTKDQTMLRDVYKWFEVDIRGAGVIADASTYAFMIHTALQESNASKANRTIKRYFSLADEAGLLDGTLARLQILASEQDFGRATLIAPNLVSEIYEEIDRDSMLTDSTPQLIHPSAETATDIPKVKEMLQKGTNFPALKKALAIFSKTSKQLLAGRHGTTELERGECFAVKRQRQLEADTTTAAIERWRSESENLKRIGIDAGLSKANIGACMWTWHEKLTTMIKEEIVKANEAESKQTRGEADLERCFYGPFLQLLPPEKVSAVTILACMSLLCVNKDDPQGLPLTRVVVNAAESLENEYLVANIHKSEKQKFRRQMDQAQHLRGISSLVKRRSPRHTLSRFVDLPNGMLEDERLSKWSQSTKARVGALLTSFLISVAKIEVICKDPQTGNVHQESQAVFLHNYQHSGGKRIGFLRLNKAMVKKLATEPLDSTLSKYLPMLIVPRPWTGFDDGAFLKHSVNAVRVKNGDYQSKKYALAASDNGDMEQMFAGLDVLSKTPWRINRGVFEVMLEGWNSGVALGKLAPEITEPEVSSETSLPEDMTERRKWWQEKRKIANFTAGLRSQRCFQNFQLEIARAYLDETFYFPHNLDFRGRAYPMVPFFNHMSADPCRGLLLFDKGKELGESGLRWLKIHVANLYGFDKASFTDRLKFTEDHLPDVFDSASNPLSGARWWLQGEDPWQCLGACMELKKALESPDPYRFVSHLPIHQDGTCNGLQHYAALGGDAVGARQVNLEPGDRPSDIYTGVAELVKAEIAEDAAQGDILAGLLVGKITRKVVKQTVMTNVYGVTFLGAKKQVRNQLDDVLKGFPDTDTANLELASRYIVTKIFIALKQMFNGARDIQLWLGECAFRISRSVSIEQIRSLEQQTNGQSPKTWLKNDKSESKKLTSSKMEMALFKNVVIWTSPLKMPVVQHYRRSKTFRVPTTMQHIHIKTPSVSDPVHLRKQLQAFPPNFIHSLDATHMMLTALKCSELGIEFASVHDSFWTHAGDVDTMNRIIRDAFIRMHSEDIIGRLAAEFRARYGHSLQYTLVPKTSAVGLKITAWRSQQSKQQGSLCMRELLLERRRLDLLASEKPQERLEGESMITAGRIFEDVAKEQDMALVTDRDVPILGGLDQRGTRPKQPIDHQLEATSLDEKGVVNPSIGSAVPGIESQEATFKDIEDDELAEKDGDNYYEQVEEAEEKLEEVEEVEEEELDNSKKDRKEKTKRLTPDAKIWLWRRLIIPPVPKKGNFDITKLRDSQYFFS